MFQLAMVGLESTGSILEAEVMLEDSITIESCSINTIQDTLERYGPVDVHNLYNGPRKSSKINFLNFRIRWPSSIELHTAFASETLSPPWHVHYSRSLKTRLVLGYEF